MPIDQPATNEPTAEELLGILHPAVVIQLRLEHARRRQLAEESAAAVERLATTRPGEGDTLPEWVERLAQWCARHGLTDRQSANVRVEAYERQPKVHVRSLDDFRRLTRTVEARRRKHGDYWLHEALVEGVVVEHWAKREDAPGAVEIIPPAESQP